MAHLQTCNPNQFTEIFFSLQKVLLFWLFYSFFSSISISGYFVLYTRLRCIQGITYFILLIYVSNACLKGLKQVNNT